METRDWDAEAETAASRDPREAPYGIFTGDRFVLASLRVFLWFESVEQLIDYLLNVEPRRYEVTPGNGLEEYQARMRPILGRVRKEGLTEELLSELNSAQDGGFVVDWWGTYSELRDGRDGFGCEVRDAFVRRRGGDEMVPVEREEEFVEFLGNYGM